MRDIFVDIENYRHAAAVLRRMSANLDDNRSNMAAIMGFVGDVWQGTASDAFIESNEWIVKDIDRLRLDIEDLAANLESAAAALELKIVR